MAAELVVPPVGEIQADRELRHAGVVQGNVALGRHQRPVRNQDDVGQVVRLLDVADDFDDVVAQQRFAPGNLHHARLQHAHVLGVLFRLELARLVPRTAVVAMPAIAVARIGDLEGNHDGAAGKPVHAALLDNPKRFAE